MTSTLLLDLSFTVTDLSRLRLRMGDCVRQAGLGEPRASEFALATYEVIANAVQHGGGGGRLWLWCAEGVLRCQVTDEGPGFTVEAIPASPPSLDSGECGRGLWLVRELSDRLHIGGGPAGAVVTLEFELAGDLAHDATSSVASLVGHLGPSVITH